jgi:hypothetical protein
MSQPPAPRPVPDTRTPEQMPTAARIEWFDASRGFGVLVTATDERIGFDADAGSGNAGDAVTVEWRRAKAGPWNVPARILSATTRPPAAAPTFTLDEWLSGFAKRCSKIRGITKRVLLDGLGDALEPFATSIDVDTYELGRGTGEDASAILHAIAHIARFGEGHERHAKWVWSFDYKDLEVFDELVPALGLAPAAVQAKLGDNPDVRDILRICNELAPGADRLYSVTTNGDSYVIVALPPAACSRLVDDGYLVIDGEVSPPARKQRRWIDRANDWLVRTLTGH